MNLPETPRPRYPRRGDDRRAQQGARPGWRPLRRARRPLARGVATSLRPHRAAGDARWTQPYEFTLDAVTQDLVCQLLAANTASHSSREDAP
jgi:hypothetical protein